MELVIAILHQIDDFLLQQLLTQAPADGLLLCISPALYHFVIAILHQVDDFLLQQLLSQAPTHGLLLYRSSFSRSHLLLSFTTGPASHRAGLR